VYVRANYSGGDGILKRTFCSALIVAVLGGAIALFAETKSALAEDGMTLKTVKERGYVTCGVTGRMPGFSVQGADGQWSGFNVDFCRALGAAVLGDSNAVHIADYWLDALVGGNVDVIHAGSTWTFKRDTEQKVEFTGINFYDGQGFIAYQKAGVKNLHEAMKKNGLKVCTISETSTAMVNLQDFMAKHNVDWTIVPMHTMDGMWRGFFGSRCDMAIHDRTALAGIHADRLKGSADFVVFPEVISKEPLSPAVRQDDFMWRDLVAWVTHVTIAAEELGVTQANVDDMKAHSNVPEIRRLLGVEKGLLGKPFGLDDEWAYRVIKLVGNYSDIFERNLGQGSVLKMSRGLNNTWQNGGLLYAPPVR